MLTRGISSLQSVVEATTAIPCAPAILPKLLALTQSDNAGAREMQSLILTDPGLATGVLRLANSAYFARSRHCESLAEAILRLGCATLYRLAATTVAGRWLTYPTRSGYGWQPGDLWRHSLCVAVAAEVYAQRSSLALPEAAYTAGLLHDVGKLALATANESALATVAELVPKSDSVWKNVETSVMGYSSIDVTRELLRNWGFPSALIAAGVYYATPSEAPEDYRGLVTVIHAAKNVAIELGFGVGADGFYCTPDEVALQSLGFDDAALTEAIPEIVERFEKLVGTSHPPGDAVERIEAPLKSS